MDIFENAIQNENVVFLNSWSGRNEIVQNAINVGSFENEALENEDRSTKHPKLENEAP